jgi:hypothetical protein
MKKNVAAEARSQINTVTGDTNLYIPLFEKNKDACVGFLTVKPYTPHARTLEEWAKLGA